MKTITRQDFERMQAQLKEGQKEMNRIKERISVAREHGDLKENAEYHAAKEAQSRLSERLRSISMKLSDTRVVEESEIVRDGTIRLNTHFSIYYGKNNEDDVENCVLVSTADSVHKQGIQPITVDSPVGKAVLGKKAGDKVVAQGPYKDIDINIESVEE